MEGRSCRKKYIFYGNYYQVFLNIITSGYIIGGDVLYVIATVLWLYLLTKFDFNYIYPMVSISFILSAIVSQFILNEHVPLNGWIGVGIITIGVIVNGLR